MSTHWGIAIASVASLTLLTLLAPGSAEAVDVYRWTDDRGVEHFTDQPRPGAERITVEPVPALDVDIPPVSPVVEPPDANHTPASPAPTYRVAIDNLTDGQTVWNDARQLPLEFSLQPPLAAERGDRLVVYLDGKARARLARAGRVVLDGLVRGPHTVWAEVVDSAGRRLATTQRVTLYHKQHSVARPKPQRSGSR